MTKDEFEKLVARALDGVPEKFASRLKNVVVLVEEGEEHGELLGLYHGVPQTERGLGDGVLMPDTITLFQHPIEREAEESGVPVAQVVRDTVWHEFAHYFGLDEGDVHLREDEGTNRYPEPLY